MTLRAVDAPSVAIVGAGVVGERVRRNLSSSFRLLPRDLAADIVVLAMPAPHAPAAARLLAAGTHVVSTSGAIDDVRDLLDLDPAARDGGASLVVGAAVSPGLSGLIARSLTGRLDGCDELHVAVHGTAGPACAREHHRALAGWALGWHDGRWIERQAGSGRELCWFPEPVGARDCYRGELADPVLLHRSFPEVERVSARTSATRRDRLTARLPMLTAPHAEGGIGALRVEARGHDVDGARVTVVNGIAELIGTATAATAAAMVAFLSRREEHGGVVTTSDADLPTDDILRDVLRYGVRLQAFTGVPS
ncbi:hypothetical protein [Desertimonas flava]|jgi:hypothetical protein|uniref:hypothetical protein n=1 Tax=Desertimonas flava TaxID=2064846 RepID=UPI000E349A32|nr:hypothetical protein [Desertimonas flava]